PRCERSPDSQPLPHAADTASQLSHPWANTPAQSTATSRAPTHNYHHAPPGVAYPEWAAARSSPETPHWRGEFSDGKWTPDYPRSATPHRASHPDADH